MQQLFVEHVLSEATSDARQTSHVLAQLLDCLHLFFNELRLQPVGQLRIPHTAMFQASKFDNI